MITIKLNLVSLTWRVKQVWLGDQKRGGRASGSQRGGEMEDGKVDKCVLLCSVDFRERSKQWVGDSCWNETIGNSV